LGLPKFVEMAVVRLVKRMNGDGKTIPIPHVSAAVLFLARVADHFARAVVANEHLGFAAFPGAAD
jgi:hypothetical protein